MNNISKNYHIKDLLKPQQQSFLHTKHPNEQKILK